MPKTVNSMSGTCRLRFQKKHVRPEIEDGSLQIRIYDPSPQTLSVKELYYNYREQIPRLLVDQETHRPAMQSLEEEFSTLRLVAQQFQKAYQTILSSKK